MFRVQHRDPIVCNLRPFVQLKGLLRACLACKSVQFQRHRELRLRQTFSALVRWWCFSLGTNNSEKKRYLDQEGKVTFAYGTPTTCTGPRQQPIQCPYCNAPTLKVRVARGHLCFFRAFSGALDGLWLKIFLTRCTSFFPENNANQQPKRSDVNASHTWLPHCPAWTCTISRMVVDGGGAKGYRCGRRFWARKSD